MKIIVWDLFGGGVNSVYNAIDKEKYEVYTFDITEPTREKHYKLDLSQDNIVDKFKDFPKPDIIVASPLCQSWSIALQMKGGGTCFWKLNESKTQVIQRTIEEFESIKGGFTKHLNAEKQLAIANLGKKCIDNTIELIKFYQPKYWYIENPRDSLIWKYITLNRLDFYNNIYIYMNKATYGLYGYPIPKNTIFMSNVKMNLKYGKCKKEYVTFLENGIEYKKMPDSSRKMKTSLRSGMIGLTSIKGGKHEATERSRIPQELLQTIFSYFIIKEGNYE